MNNPNTKSNILILGLIFLVLISACSNLQTEQDFTDTKWQWYSLSENEPASQSVVPDPENYTITLNSDGSMNIQADCNMVEGSYSVEGNTLSLIVGPSTMAFCGDESLDLMFIELLSNVESYSMENNELILNLNNNAGKMALSK